MMKVLPEVSVHYGSFGDGPGRLASWLELFLTKDSKVLHACDGVADEEALIAIVSLLSSTGEKHIGQMQE